VLRVTCSIAWHSEAAIAERLCEGRLNAMFPAFSDVAQLVEQRFRNPLKPPANESIPNTIANT